MVEEHFDISPSEITQNRLKWVSFAMVEEYFEILEDGKTHSQKATR